LAVDGPLEQDRQARSLTTAGRQRPSLAELEDRLGHHFTDRTLLERALTHVGAAPAREASYQRLEFLGDRVLGLAVADMLFAAFPAATEGELSRRLAALVRRETCAAVAAGWAIEPHIRLASGEGSRLKRAILGDIAEAVIGAVFLDGGLAAARALVERDFAAAMREAPRALRDPKTTLQEWAQGRGLAAPLYRERARSGPDHAPEFTVAVMVEQHAEAVAKGRSKRLAEQAAAAAFMGREGVDMGERA
jgi:ribonuclease III